MALRFRCALVILLMVTSAAAFAQDDGPIKLRLISWNVEGNGDDIDPDLIERQLAEKEEVDLWGLSEVRPGLFDEFVRGAAEGEGTDFEIIEGSTGSNIRLAIIYDKSVLNLEDSIELDDDVFEDHRAPLAAKFEGQRTGQRFIFMVNHLARGNASARREQAEFLNDWARDQELPVIVVGDMNMDFDIDDGDSGERDPAFDALVADDVFRWLRPRVLLKTQADDRFNTVLDFVFLANVDQFEEAGWTGTSRILDRSSDSLATTIDFDDSDRESDHRPVDAILTLEAEPERRVAAAAEPEDTRELISRLLREVETLRKEVRELRRERNR